MMQDVIWYGSEDFVERKENNLLNSCWACFIVMAGFVKRKSKQVIVDRCWRLSYNPLRVFSQAKGSSTLEWIAGKGELCLW